jgi:hypothetical protein
VIGTFFCVGWNVKREKWLLTVFIHKFLYSF